MQPNPEINLGELFQQAKERVLEDQKYRVRDRIVNILEGIQHEQRRLDVAATNNALIQAHIDEQQAKLRRLENGDWSGFDDE